MKKLIFIILIGIMLTTVFLSGCNEENNQGKNRFVGSWKFDRNPNEIYIFKEDNTGTHNSLEMTFYFSWEDNGSALCITPADNLGDIRCGSYKFSNNDNSFTWTVRENEIEFEKIN